MLKVKSTLTAMTQPEQNRQPLSPDQVSQQGRRRDLRVRPCSPLCWQAAKVPSLQFRTCTCSRVEHKSPNRAGFLTLFVAFIPRTTSERRISVVVSPCTLTTDPGRGGKLVAARSNFGDSGAAAFIKGAGLCGVHHSRMRNEQVREDASQLQNLHSSKYFTDRGTFLFSIPPLVPVVTSPVAKTAVTTGNSAHHRTEHV